MILLGIGDERRHASGDILKPVLNNFDLQPLQYILYELMGVALSNQP
jgi:hypothetical protein